MEQEADSVEEQEQGIINSLLWLAPAEEGDERADTLTNTEQSRVLYVPRGSNARDRIPTFDPPINLASLPPSATLILGLLRPRKQASKQNATDGVSNRGYLPPPCSFHGTCRRAAMPCTSSKVAPRPSSNARPLHGHSLLRLLFLRSLRAQLATTTSSSTRRKKIMTVIPRGRPGTGLGLRRPMLILFCCLLLAFFPCHVSAFHTFVGTYGVNYGQIADNIPKPPDVVRLLQMSKIKNVRIFDSNHDILDAFRNSGLNLAIAIPNGLVKDISANPAKAMDWVNENVQPYYPSTRIVAVIVGNEILGGADSGLAEALIGAVVNVHDALRALRLSKLIEVNTPHSEAVFGSSYPPSNGTFRPELMVYLNPLLNFFSKTGASFYVNAYPFLAYMSDPAHIDIKYALMEPNAGILDPKTNLHYDNMFEAQIDATYSALEAAGYPDMEVRVSETGWASEGDASETAATLDNARTYNFNLRKRLFLRKGTPYRPKRVVKAFIFALFNEDLKTGPDSERHFGLFKPDGSVSLDLGFKGLTSSSSSLLNERRAKGWIVRYSEALLSYTFVFLALAAA